MNRIATVLLTLLLAATILIAANDPMAQTASDRWHTWRRAQEAYPLACWAYFQRFPGAVEEYEMYAGANLNMVSAPDDQVANAGAAGLNVLLGAWQHLHEHPEKLDKLMTFPDPDVANVIGYQMVDEPRPPAFPGIRRALDIVYTRDTRNTLPIVDMLPNWAWQRNTRRVERFGMYYGDFLDEFVRTCRPPVLLNCHYPPLADGSDRPEYYANFETFRDCTLANDIGMMGFVLVSEHGNNRLPSESDLRWQVYTALAYGSQGIWYWNWRIKERPPFGPGMVDYQTGQPKPIYHQAKAINAQVLALGPVLMSLKSRSVFHTGDTVPPGTRRFPHECDPGMTALARFEGDDFIVGEFVNQDDPADRDAYVMIVNKRHGKGLHSTDLQLQATARFRPNVNYGFVYIHDLEDGIQPLPHAADGAYELPLAGGQGTLLRLSRQPLLGEPTAAYPKASWKALYARGGVDIDGDLKEGIWRRNEQPLTVINIPADQPATPQETGHAWVTWNDHTLYIAARFQDTDLLAQGTADDQPHYKLGDVLEIFIKPALTEWYWELWISPNGHHTSTFWTRRNQLGAEHDQPFTIDYQAAAQTDGTLNDSDDTDNGWTCEVAIPFAELTQQGKLPLQGPWTICIARQNFTGQVDTQHRELTAHPRLSAGTFHHIADYAQLQLDLR